MAAVTDNCYDTRFEMILEVLNIHLSISLE